MKDNQLTLFSDNEMKDMEPLPVWVNGVPFVDEVETFNKTFGKPSYFDERINRSACFINGNGLLAKFFNLTNLFKLFSVI